MRKFYLNMLAQRSQRLRITRNYSLPSQKNTISKVAQISELLKLVFNFIVFIILLIIIANIIVEIKKDAILLKPVSVPKLLQERGLNANVVARKLKDEVSNIKEGADSDFYLCSILRESIEKKEIKPYLSDLPEVELPDIQITNVGFNFKSLIRYVYNIFGREPKILESEIYVNNKSMVMSMRMGKDIYAKLDAPLNEIDIMMFNMAVEIYKNVEPLTLAVYYIVNNQYEQAEYLLNQCLRNKSTKDDALANFLRGNIYYSQQKYSLSIQNYNKALKIKSNYFEALLNRGTAYLGLKKYSLAKNDFEQALERKPNDFRANMKLGVVDTKLGYDSSASARFEKAKKVMDKEKWQTIEGAFILSWLGKYDEALSYILKMNEKNILAVSLMSKPANFEQLDTREKVTLYLEHYKNMIKKVGDQYFIYDSDPQNNSSIKGNLKLPQLKVLDQLLELDKRQGGLRLAPEELNKITRYNSEVKEAYDRWRKCKDMMRSYIYPSERYLYLPKSNK